MLLLWPLHLQPASFTATAIAIGSQSYSVVTPVAADAAFGNAFNIATLIATYTGADVTVVGNIIVQNNPTFLLLCWLL